MLNTTMVSTAAIALNLSSLITTIIIGSISLFLFTVLLRSIVHNTDIVLILVANNYLALFTFALVAAIINIDIVRDDYNLVVDEETVGCRVRGYILYSLIGVIFNTFALQAVFRFFRVVHSSHIWLQRRRTYIAAIPFIWIIPFLLLLPLYIWHDIQLIPMGHICMMAIYSVRGFIWSTIAVYGLPMNVISMVYFRLVRFMRRSSMVASTQVKRDVIVVRRIVIVVFILMVIGIPCIVLEMISLLTDVTIPFFYRITGITVDIGMFVLSLMLVYVSPQLKEILVRIIQRNQVTPLNTE